MYSVLLRVKGTIRDVIRDCENGASQQEVLSKLYVLQEAITSLGELYSQEKRNEYKRLYVDGFEELVYEMLDESQRVAEYCTTGRRPS